MTENNIIDGFVNAIDAAMSDTFRLIEPFDGGLDEAVKRLANEPACLVLLGKIDFSDDDEAGELLQGDPDVQVLTSNRSLRSKKETISGAYDILPELRNTLNGATIDGSDWRIIKQQPVDVTSRLSVWSQIYRARNAYF